MKTLTLCLLLLSSPAHADSWMLLRQTHGGDLKFDRNLSQEECEVARDRLLGLPATQEEKQTAKEKQEKEKREQQERIAKDIEKIVKACQALMGASTIVCDLEDTALEGYGFRNPKQTPCEISFYIVTCKGNTSPKEIRAFLTLLGKEGMRTSGYADSDDPMDYSEPESGATKTAECFHLKEEAGQKAGAK